MRSPEKARCPARVPHPTGPLALLGAEIVGDEAPNRPANTLPVGTFSGALKRYISAVTKVEVRQRAVNRGLSFIQCIAEMEIATD